MDFTPILQALVSVAAASIPVLVGKAWTWLSSQIHSNDVGLVSNAVSRVAGEIVDALTATPESEAAFQNLKETLVHQGVKALVNVRIPDTVRKLGVTEETLAGMVRGELGKLLAQGAGSGR